MIEEFQGDYRWLSNFWPARVKLDDVFYSSTEHGYVAAKTLIESEREMIRLASTPGKAKRLGKKITLREDWEDVKLSVMDSLLRQKFAQYDLYFRLRDTGDQLIQEGNRWHDNYWGNCICHHCQDIYGQNHLGKLIMKIRSEMRPEADRFRDERWCRDPQLFND